MGHRERVFLAGQSVSLLGDGLAALTIPLLVLQLNRNPTVSALSGASATLGYLAIGIPTGPLVDRLDPWRLLVAMDAVRTLLFFALFAVADSGGVVVVLAIAIATGVARVLFETAFVVVVHDLFPGAGLVRANARIELATQLSLVIGPGAVAGLVALGSLRLALFADALTFVVSVASLLSVRARSRPHVPVRRSGKLVREFVDGLRYLAGVRVLVMMTCVQLAANFSLAVEKLIVYYARVTLGLSAGGVALVAAAGGFGGILGALTAAEMARRIGDLRLILAAVAVAGVAIGSVGLTGSLPALAAAHLVYLWALVMANVVNRSRRQALVAREFLGRVTSAQRMMFRTVDALGVLVAGALTSALGDVRPVFVAAGVLVVGAAAGGRCDRSYKNGGLRQV